MSHQDDHGHFDGIEEAADIGMPDDVEALLSTPTVTPPRPFEDSYIVPPGMPREVWTDKYARKKLDGTYQSWAERSLEAVDGNFRLDARDIETNEGGVRDDYFLTQDLARRGLWAMSGRHMQHGDANQKSKVGDLFMSCTTALFAWGKFWLLMKGSGCSRSYDSDVHFVNWDNLPHCHFVLSVHHPDYNDSIESLEEAQHKCDSESDDTRWFEVEDSAEGWAKVLMIMETAAFHKNNRDTTFIFDFSKVRGKGALIKGQQNRPSSGPVPLIKALEKVMRIRGLKWKPWKQSLFIDHYCSDCIRLGGVRRSARLAAKHWRDKDILEFIDLKRGGWLWTANNSIIVDEEFWQEASDPRPSHGRRVFEAAIAAAFYDKTGEPGFVNADKLAWDHTGAENITVDNYIGDRVKTMFGGIHERTLDMIDYTLEKAKKKRYPFLPNPCGEELMAIWGSYCTVGDNNLAQARDKQDAINGARMVAQSLVRVNKMEFLYAAEVLRTNRIGVSLIGIFEYMWEKHGITIKDAVKADDFFADKYNVDPKSISLEVFRFWDTIDEMRIATEDEANKIARIHGLVNPHTVTCIKPGGTIPKPLNCTEGANPPPMPYYMRWVQFSNDHPGLKAFADRGYPVRDISRSETRIDHKTGRMYTVNGYPNTSIVGFPTKMRIADLMGDALVTAYDLSLDEYFAWLRLLEKHWLGGPGKNAQISITIKYNPEEVSYQEFMQTILEQQRTVRCAAVMPQEDTSAYIYVPEQLITKDEYETYMAGIDKAEREAIDENTLGCENGVCGIDRSRNASIVDELAAAAGVDAAVEPAIL